MRIQRSIRVKLKRIKLRHLALPVGLLMAVVLSLSNSKAIPDPIAVSLGKPDTTPVEVPKVISRDRARINTVISDFAAGKGGNWGIYVYEFDTGVSYGYNQTTSFTAASTNKVPILAKVYMDIEAGKLSRETLITKQSGDFESGTGILQGEPNGKKYKVSYLANIMIQKSDNIATNMLIRTVGRSNVQALMNSHGLAIDMFKNLTTPDAMGKLISKLYQSELTSKASKDEMFGLMYKTAFENRLPRNIPADVRVLHKIGTSGTISDVGVVEMGERPYVICAYVSGLKATYAEDSIAELSKLIHDYEASL